MCKSDRETDSQGAVTTLVDLAEFARVPQRRSMYRSASTELSLVDTFHVPYLADPTFKLK
jgi:hypothetical protein